MSLCRVANGGGPAQGRVCVSPGASLNNEYMQKFNEALALKEILGAMVMHLWHNGPATKRNCSR